MVFGPAGGETVSRYALLETFFNKDVNGLLEQHMVSAKGMIDHILRKVQKWQVFW